MKRLSTILVILVLLFCGMTNASFARAVGEVDLYLMESMPPLKNSLAPFIEPIYAGASPCVSIAPVAVLTPIS
jgi:hypothetical protein